mmetsp:Transcript_129907/g.277381  ORF Transcript_129907/g.277381 Transcript_129907/m.277381 type:complete len:200 (-) Transcript_129907:1055-1654(-)
MPTTKKMMRMDPMKASDWYTSFIEPSPMRVLIRKTMARQGVRNTERFSPKAMLYPRVKPVSVTTKTIMKETSWRWATLTAVMKVVMYGMKLMYFTALNQVRTELTASKLWIIFTFIATPCMSVKVWTPCSAGSPTKACKEPALPQVLTRQPSVTIMRIRFAQSRRFQASVKYSVFTVGTFILLSPRASQPRNSEASSMR